jgi:pyrimidine operon attenuation protein/uracil phosphoribosyltransferase
MLQNDHPPTHPRLVGVASGGVWLAERLQQDLNLPAPIGVLSSSMHRDDFAQRGLATGAKTHLPFEVNGAHLIVLDDVIYTGRTVRAVLNELFDYGRPASVRLAVLVDRGGRQLPVQADLAVARVSLPAGQSLQLARDANGRLSLDVQGG